MKRSQLAINSVSTRGDFEESLAAYAGAGFTKVEFTLAQVKEFMSQGRSVDDVRGLLDRYGLTCIGGFESSVVCFAAEQDRIENFKRHVANAELIAALGGRIMVVGTDGPSGGRLGYEEVVSHIAGALRELAEAISHTGVTICLEFNWSPVVKSLRTAVEIAKQTGMKNVGVLFDPAHYHCTPTKFEQINQESVAHIKHVHVDDMRDKPGEHSDCNADRVLPGEGCLDLRALLGALERYGYQGFYSIEMFNADLWSRPAAESAKLMYESLVRLCDSPLV